SPASSAPGNPKASSNSDFSLASALMYLAWIDLAARSASSRLSLSRSCQTLSASRALRAACNTATLARTAPSSPTDGRSVVFAQPPTRSTQRNALHLSATVRQTISLSSADHPIQSFSVVTIGREVIACQKVCEVHVAPRHAVQQFARSILAGVDGEDEF